MGLQIDRNGMIVGHGRRDSRGRVIYLDRRARREEWRASWREYKRAEKRRRRRRAALARWEPWALLAACVALVVLGWLWGR